MQGSTATLEDSLVAYNKCKQSYHTTQELCSWVLTQLVLNTYVHVTTCMGMFIHNHQKLEATKTFFSI